MRKNSLMLAVVLIATMAVIGCTRIGPGHVGIKVSMAGSDRGVQDVPAVTGWVFYNPMLSSVFEYPTYVQTAVWTKDKNEGSPTNEEISFNSKEGLVVNGDISLSYQLDGSKVPHFYVKFRSDQLKTFTHGYMRNQARDAFNEVASTYAIEDIYGPKKEEFIQRVKARLNTTMKDVGVTIEQFGFIGAPRLPQNIIEAINGKIAATQAAMQAENELRRTQAEAAKNVAAAEGTARANRVIAESITPNLITWRQMDLQQAAISRWDGKKAMVEGGGQGMLLQISPTR